MSESECDELEFYNRETGETKRVLVPREVEERQIRLPGFSHTPTGKYSAKGISESAKGAKMNNPEWVFEYNMGIWKPIEYPFDTEPEGIKDWDKIIRKAGYLINDSLGHRQGGFGQPVLTIYARYEGESPYPFFCEATVVFDYGIDVFLPDHPSMFMFVNSISSFAMLKLFDEIAGELEAVLEQQARRSQRIP